MKKPIIVFDTETNGFAGSSLLSISAIKGEADRETGEVEIIDKYNRWYYVRPGEKPNYYATKVHGLFPDKIALLRGKCDYPKHFDDDIQSFRDFCPDPCLFIAHNISFDKKFVPFIEDVEDKYRFCTMHKLKKILGLPKKLKLMKLAEHYEINVTTDRLHDSAYDTEICFKIFAKYFKSCCQKKKDDGISFTRKR
jgi:DNA polymerase-3 subunit epsilon